MIVVLVTFTSGTGPGMSAGGMTGKRLAALPEPISVPVVRLRFGEGPGGEVPAGGLGEAGGLPDTERGGLVLAVGDTERVGLALGVGAGEPGRVGLGLGVGPDDAERVGLGVEVGDAERVGLGVDVGVGDVDGVELSLAVGVGAAVDGAAEGDVDCDGDGLGELEALEPEVVLAAAGVEGETVTALANAGSCVLTDSPGRRKPPVTRPAITARRCPRDM
jgi:hypothetical protein